MTHKLSVIVKCPKCSVNLNVHEEVYADEEGFESPEIEWECPNGCVYDDDTLERIDTEIEERIWGYHYI